MTERVYTIGVMVKNDAIKKEFMEAANANGFRCRNSTGALNSDILVMEIGEDLEKEFLLIQDAQKSHPIRDVFLTSSRTESEILLRALRSGAREFFPQPLNLDDFRGALSKFLDRNKDSEPADRSRRKGEIITFIGSKGGIGTSTVAVNFATNLYEVDSGCQSVVLVDMNLIFGDLPLFLDVDPAFNWGEIARNISRLDPTFLLSVLSKHESGIYLLPSPTGLDGVNLATPQVIERLLSLMKVEFDYIVIDIGHSLNEISLKALEMSDRVVINFVSSLPCLVNMKRLLESFKQIGYPKEDNIEIVLSRHQKNSMISPKEAEEGLGKKIFWFVPNDYLTTMSAINQGKSLATVNQKAEITRNIKDFSAKIVAKDARVAK